MKAEFSKKLLVIDYIVFCALIVCQLIRPDIDLSGVIIAWVAQLGISSAAYYWKAKCENRTKVPLKVVEDLPADIREQIDLTQVITSIIQSD